MLKASDDFPEPEGPVTTVSWRCGMSTEMFLRLCVLAPRMAMVREGIFECRTLRDLLCHPERSEGSVRAGSPPSFLATLGMTATNESRAADRSCSRRAEREASR